MLRQGMRKAAAVDDKLKEQLLPAVMVFNFILAAYMSVRVIYPTLTSNRPLHSGAFFTQLLIGAGIGLIAAAITLTIMMRRK
jgi:hypothetical protein